MHRRGGRFVSRGENKLWEQFIDFGITRSNEKRGMSYMRRIIILCAVAALIWAACEDKAIEGGESEVWKGELAVHKRVEGYQWPFIDTDQVTFTVEGGLYTLKHTTNPSQLCNTQGLVRNFGRNIMTLEVTGSEYAACDSVRVPEGDFDAIFRGDSLYIGPKTVSYPRGDTVTFHFMLKQS